MKGGSAGLGGIGFLLAIAGHMLLLELGYDFGSDGPLVAIGLLIAFLLIFALVMSILGYIGGFFHDKLNDRKNKKWREDNKELLKEREDRYWREMRERDKKRYPSKAKR
jgi:hypothetical protein